MSFINKTILLLITFWLSACSSTAPVFIVAPEMSKPLIHQYSTQTSTLKVRDLRPQQQLVQIKKAQLFNKNAAIELVNSKQLLPTVVADNLTQLWHQQGLTISPQSSQSITVDIKQALVDVEQGMVKYQAQNHLILTVTVARNGKTLTKTFSTNGASNGPLTADFAVLERDFNQQLGQLLTTIVSDPELVAFIR